MHVHLYADLHIHIGRTQSGQAVKVTASRDLTLENILHEARDRKGLQVIGVVDTASPGVQADLERLIEQGELTPLPQGGLEMGSLLLLLGVEVEAREENGGLSHHLSFFPDLQSLGEYSRFLRGHLTNINLSSQSTGLPGRVIGEVTRGLGGEWFPAHIFTPHKSLYGSATDRLGEFCDPSLLSGVELGLSSDTQMADRIEDLKEIPFITNSDAHSLPKIAREFNLVDSEGWGHRPFFSAIASGRIVGNFGLDPRLGKYHRSYCPHCDALAPGPPPVKTCPSCGGPVILGVFDRLEEIATHREPQHPVDRPPYHHIIPLQFIPGLGPKRLDLLIQSFGSEMAVLHQATLAELTQVVGEELAQRIERARTGKSSIGSGGGGRYGRVDLA